MFRRILQELKAHAPFTLLGSLTGVVVMVIVVLTKLPPARLEPVFEGFHTGHVLLSAIVTAGLYRRYRTNIAACVLIGFVGSVGIATLSDIIFPHHGGALLLELTGEHHGMHDLHLPFIDEWWLINPAALIGVGIGIAWPKTKVPHAGHVLLSTWASLFYLVVHSQAEVSWLPRLPLVLVVLFIAVWLPCCVSDIVFPLLFVGKQAREQGHEGHEHQHH